MQKNDQQLIADYLNGDEEAFAVLAGRYLKPIYNFTYRLVGDRQNAEDITQETFFKTWKNLKKYRAGESFRAWLYRIARNTAYDLLRKKRTLVFADFENGDEDGENYFADTIADREPLVSELLIRLEDKKLLEDILNRLPPVYREVLFLHYGESFTFAEIGGILRKSVNTVKSRHRRALIMLREVLDAPKNGDGAYK